MRPALGCRGVACADFRYDGRRMGTEGLVCLELNTQLGMTETPLVPGLAARTRDHFGPFILGLSFDELVRWMVEDASLDR